MTQSAVSCFVEGSTSERLTIPSHKPSIQNIMHCQVIPHVINCKYISTSLGLSYDGCYLSGHQALVTLSLEEELTYIASNTTETLHAIHYTFMKTVRVPLTFCIPDISPNQFQANILSVHTQIITPTSLQQNILFAVSLNSYLSNK